MNSIQDHRYDIFQDGGTQGQSCGRVDSRYIFPMVNGRSWRGFTTLMREDSRPLCARIQVPYVRGFMSLMCEDS